MAKIEQDEFHGKPFLKIFKDDKAERPTISFGLQKAKVILEAMGEIEKFVKEQTGNKNEK